MILWSETIEGINYIIQTCGMGSVLIFLLKLFLMLRKIWLKQAIKNREKYNKKHGLSRENGFAEINVNSLSYQIDSIESSVVIVIVFLIGLLFSLFVPLQDNNIFCIFTLILVGFAYTYCWIMRNKGTKKFRVIAFISCGVSIIFVFHILVSYITDKIILIRYINSVNALLYLWFTLLMYKVLIDKKT